MRLFFALWPPRDTARALGDWAKRVQRDSGGRATAEDTIHLTLAFLGDVDPARASTAARRVRGSAFELPIDAAKYWRHNAILWVGPETTPPPLEDLVRQLHGALREDGFTLDARPFAVHITLIRKGDAPKTIPALPTVAWPAAEFVLVRSTPTRAGSRYDVVERFPFHAR